MGEEEKKEEGVQLSPEDLEAIGFEAPVRDLDGERDARVIPFVSEFLSALGTHEFHFTKDKAVLNDKEEDESYNTFYSEKFMPTAMTKGLFVTDMHYTFSLTKKVVEMLQNRSTQPADEMRVVPCALELMEALGKAGDLMLKSDISPEDGIARAQLYDDLYKDLVVPIFMKHEVEYNEVMQVFATMASIIGIVEHKTANTLQHAQELADSKLWGVPDTNEITIKQLHEKCIEPVDNKTQ